MHAMIMNTGFELNKEKRKCYVTLKKEFTRDIIFVYFWTFSERAKKHSIVEI